VATNGYVWLPKNRVGGTSVLWYSRVTFWGSGNVDHGLVFIIKFYCHFPDFRFFTPFNVTSQSQNLTYYVFYHHWLFQRKTEILLQGFRFHLLHKSCDQPESFVWSDAIWWCFFRLTQNKDKNSDSKAYVAFRSLRSTAAPSATSRRPLALPCDDTDSRSTSRTTRWGSAAEIARTSPIFARRWWSTVWLTRSRKHISNAL